ncbi:hypothetical protein QY049_38025 [Bradyrhizobium sp. WYCCWR 13022]|uniref:hypothetical protein n=1 Tax=unclassified Bradyrhizobium TaxID=2631580 RepID=UPI00263ABEAE|nr:hypothetical protein [Bradyrhizobium sp. WYCCWR 13022]MDN4988947.1 hypothetical protein [Bradyrhizobium sp. WYCCWR 13022]
MTKFPWKAAITVSAILAATAYAFAQMPPDGAMGMHGHMQQGGTMDQMHQQMMQRGGAGNHSMMHGAQAGPTSIPTSSGQDAFGAIQEIVQMLQADPKTDWSKVNIEMLRQHLIDMNEVTLHAIATQRDVNNGIEIKVTGEGRVLPAIKRMVPAHVTELREMGWNAKSDDLPDGVTLTVTASEAQPLIKLKALGFMGIMVQGSHHQLHHLMMAEGQFVH